MRDSLNFALGILRSDEIGIVACTTPDIEHIARFVVEQRKQRPVAVILVDAALSAGTFIHE
jgi:hypothetical protein